jgi:uncharacterized cupin superfamily protein
MGAVVGTLFGSTPIQNEQLQNINQAQSGQANTYNGQQAQSQFDIQQQQNLANQLAVQNGIGNQSQVYNQQQALAQQLGQMAQGQGPNPALAQLAQTTGQNVSNQAALMAGQRGASQNAGLIARQAGMQGAAAQQQAAGQAATLQAQQQLGAVGALQQQQGMLGSLATQQVGQQQGALSQVSAQQLAQQQAAANQQQMAANIAYQQNQQNTALAQAQTQQGNQQTAMWGSIAGAVAGAAGGGEIPEFATGGPVFANSSNQAANLKANYKGKSKIGAHLFAHGGKPSHLVDALVSPGEKILPPKEAKAAKDGKVNPMKAGKTVPGKAAVGGAINSYSNDTVPAKLKPGSIVLPRSVTQAANPDGKAKQFVEAIKSKKGKK